jgi:hypothetical protein
MATTSVSGTRGDGDMADFEFLFYRGKGLISKGIQWQTRSIYSHVAVRCKGYVYEAWHTGGDWPWSGRVRRLGHPLDGHDDRTPIDIYQLNNPSGFDIDAAESYLKSQLGKSYDFSSVFRFISRRKAPSNKKLFCSEYGMECALAGGKILLHMLPSEAAPAHLSISPELSYMETINGTPDPSILAVTNISLGK